MQCRQLPSGGACAPPLLRQSALLADTCSCSCRRQESLVSTIMKTDSYEIKYSKTKCLLSKRNLVSVTIQLARPAFNKAITAGEHISPVVSSQHCMQAGCMVNQLGKAQQHISNFLQTSGQGGMLCLLVKGKGALLQLSCFLQQLPLPFGHVHRPHSWRSSSSLRPTAVTPPAHIILFIPPAPPQL